MSDSEFYAKMHTQACRSAKVPREACYVSFGHGRIVHSQELGVTVRGELVSADFDEEGRIVEIELVGAHKPCQQ